MVKKARIYTQGEVYKYIKSLPEQEQLEAALYFIEVIGQFETHNPVIWKPEYNLMPQERRILNLLVRYKNQVVTYDKILYNLYPINHDNYDYAIIKVLMSKIRNKLKLDKHKPVRTIYKEGYIYDSTLGSLEKFYTPLKTNASSKIDWSSEMDLELLRLWHSGVSWHDILLEMELSRVECQERLKLLIN